MPAGRPSSYKEEYNEQAYKLSLLGATDKQMADFWGVTEQTINNWKTDFPDFFESLKSGKVDADANVAKSLYHRALGYSHPEEKVFSYEGRVVTYNTTKHYPPDTAAAFIWLKNRQPEIWRDKQNPDPNDEAYRIFTDWLNHVKNVRTEPEADTGD